MTSLQKEIYWKIFLDTKDMGKAQKISQVALTALAGSTLISCERSTNDTSAHELVVSQDCSSSAPAEVISEVLGKVTPISSVWQINLRTGIGEQNADLSGTASSNFKLIGIKWASFMVQDA